MRYLVKKFLILFFSLFVVASLTFCLIQNIPGDPFTQENVIPEEILKSMYRHYGLDEPWHVQYGRYLKNLITWDLGPSFQYEGRSVNAIIKEGFPISFTLGLEALFISISLGILLGSIAILKHGKWGDRLITLFSVLGISLPSFIVATILQYLFAMQLDLFPVARWGTLAHSILPALSLAALPTAFISRMIRATMIEVVHQDYIQTARAKGLGPIKILIRHMLRNAILPVITYLGPLTASILTGSFVVEKIFGIPGLGEWFVNSITNRDYTTIMGVTVFYSSILMIAILLVDLLYCVIDPRINLIEEKARHG